MKTLDFIVGHCNQRITLRVERGDTSILVSVISGVVTNTEKVEKVQRIAECLFVGTSMVKCRNPSEASELVAFIDNSAADLSE